MKLSKDQIFEMIAKNEISDKDAYEMLRELDAKPIGRGSSAGGAVTTTKSFTAKSNITSYVRDYLFLKIRQLFSSSDREFSDAFSDDMNFMDMGIDSTQLIGLAGNIERELSVELYPTLFFEYQNLNELTKYFTEKYSEIFEKRFQEEFTSDTETVAPQRFEQSQQAMEISSIPCGDCEESKAHDDIAIIGMAGVFAKGKTLDEYWNNIKNKENLISEIPLDHFDYRPWFDQNVQAEDKMYCKWGSFIDDVDKFDASFFNIAPREAERMDPQLRYLLQILYWTAEDAGYMGKIRGTNTGIYVGACFHDYLQEMDRNSQSVAPHDGTGNAASMLANRPSFYLNLRGPSLSVDTACSSSLVALHIARRALQNNECDMAFVAGVNLLLGSWHYRYFCSIGALSPSGRCHTFDQRADGYVPGEGIAAVLLKPLKKALRDNDRIYAVIKGSAINHGGYTPSITAPSTRQEAQVIIDAWEDARINPESLGYIEAHGTGTKLGDPVEIDGLKMAFERYTHKTGFCAIGSAKAHIGHLEGAAGIAGIIKTVLSMKNGQIPAMPTFSTLNPYIKLDDSPLFINEKCIPWRIVDSKPRRAGVSSFGFGGTYAHVVLEEYEVPGRLTQDIGRMGEGNALIVLSASDGDRLREYVTEYVSYLNSSKCDSEDVVSDVVEFEEKIRQIVAGIMSVGSEDIDVDVAFEDYGIDEAKLAKIAGVVSEIFDTAVGLNSFISAGTIRAFATYLQQCVKEKRGGNNSDVHIEKSSDARTIRNLNIADIAYTLQVGREAMDERLAVVADNIDDLNQKLQMYLAGEENIKNLHTGNIKSIKDKDGLIHGSEDDKEFIKQLFKHRNLNKLAALWVTGAEIEWDKVYASMERKPRRISLPTYPFKRERYWRRERMQGTAVIARTPEPDVNKRRVQLTKVSEAAITEPSAHAPTQLVEQDCVPQRSEELAEARRDMKDMERVARDVIRESVLQVLYLKAEEIDDNKKFAELGLDSITAVEAVKKINDTLHINLPVVKLYDFSTISDLARHINQEFAENVAGYVGETGHLKADRIEEKRKYDVVREEQVVASQNTCSALVISCPANIEDIKLGSIKIKKPERDEVQIQTRASSINFADLLCIKGLYPTMPDYPFVPGFEVAGKVIGIGDAVSKFKKGDEVFGVTGKMLGGHAEVVNVSQHLLVRKPPAVTFEEACAVPIAFLTAYYALYEIGRLKKSDKVLIQNAAGGVGSMAVQLARLRGAELYGTAGSAEKLEYLKKAGVDHAINYREEDFFQKITTLTDGYGVDVVLNTLTGEAIQKGMNLLAPGGRYLEIAVAALKTSHSIDLSHMVNNQEFHSIDLRRLLFNSDASSIETYFEIMKEMLEQGTILAQVCETLPFREIVDGYRYLNERKNIGRVVISFTENKVKSFDVKNMGAVNVTSQSRSLNLSKSPNDIAVIGMSGRFPGAKDIGKFWNNLISGVNSITEVPPERWDFVKYYDEDTAKENKTYSKWGGFVDDVDKFDPLFFNISPAEAEYMDPQQRLFLEESWKALEDSGYNARKLFGVKCGVFVGVGQGDYGCSLEDTEKRVNAQTLLGTSVSVLSARISYILNLKGPSLAIDTACSSSLVAVHEACRSIIDGESEIALAGGVCVMTTPMMHIMTSNMGMLSHDGRCKTFDNGADGFVPAEGVGVLVLKPISKAVMDGDYIYGVIRGSSINQDGATNGITAPSGESQKSLELGVYKKYGINPETISYVEAHGTGTKLGDPLEVQALTEAFNGYTDEKQYCAIGAVKTNIGHALTASGVASLIKVLLCLKNRSLVPSINFSQPNEHIRFEDTPFYVNTEYKPWKSIDEAPRRAAISSFGFSGTNCHMIIEEYLGNKTTEPTANGYLKIFVLSARNQRCLADYANEFYNYLSENIENVSLDDLTYTLQLGREAMEARLAIVVKDVVELKEKLRRYLEGVETIEQVHTGNIRILNDKNGVVGQSEEDKEYIGALFRHGDLNKIAAFWVNGSIVDWEKLYESMERKPQRISLPTYPFKRERYWLPDGRVESASGVGRLHELLDSNESTLKEQCYRKALTGSEYYLRDHVVGGTKVLPGVAYVEMARLAGDLAGGGSKVKRIKDVVWQRPARVEGSTVEVNVNLYPGDGHVEYEVSSSATNGGERLVNSQGKIEYRNEGEITEGERIDLAAIRSRCTESKDKETCYRIFRENGLSYGPCFQAISGLQYNDSEALAELQLPTELRKNFGEYVLHPSLMDGALQAVMGLMGDIGEGTYVPFSLGAVEIIGLLEERCYSYVRLAEGSKGGIKRFDIIIANESGEALVRLKDFVVRQYSKEMLSATKPSEGLICLAEDWIEAEIVGEPEPISGAVLLVNGSDTAQAVLQSMVGTRGRVLRVRYGEGYKELGEELYEVSPADEGDYRKLLECLRSKDINPDKVVYVWEGEDFREESEVVDSSLNRGIYSLYSLTHALMEEKPLSETKILCVNKSKTNNLLISALGGFGKSVNLENKRFKYKIITLGSEVPADALMNTIKEELECWGERGAAEIKYDVEKRYERRFREIEINGSESSTPILSEGGVYVITGGMGGLGLIFARYLSKEYKAKLVLAGRRDIDSHVDEQLKEICESGGEAIYLKCDVTKREQVRELLRAGRERYGRLDGIIHAAGVLRDAFLLKKTREDFESVIGPKVYGAINLDLESQDAALEFIVFFSSIAGVMGNVGQTDYAYANRFMDYFAEWREVQRREGKRHGKALSIDWPLWEKGGMTIDEEMKTWMKNKFGMNLLTTANGLDSFRKAINYHEDNICIMEGNVARIRRQLGLVIPTERKSTSGDIRDEKGPRVSDSELISRVEKDMIGLCVELLKVNREDLDLDVDLSKYGMDSIVMMKMLNRIESMYDITVDINLIARNPTIRQFVNYVSNENKEKADKEPPLGDERKEKGGTFLNHKGSYNKTHDISETAILNGSDVGTYTGSSHEEQMWRSMLLLDNDNIVDSLSLDRFSGKRKFLFPVFELFSRMVWRLSAVGLENLPEPPFIMAPNHASHLDGLWTLSLLRSQLRNEVFGIGKKELLEGQVTKLFASMSNLIPIDRKGDFMPALRAGAMVLKSGRVLILHPEGTRTSDGTLLPFKSGIGILAMALHVPVVLVGIKGNYEVFPNNIMLPRLFSWSKMSRHRITVTFGKPITIDDEIRLGNMNADSDTIAEDFSRLLRSRIAELL